MATLNPSNIVDGNVISASDITALYDALSSGGGYDVSISGSLTGSATTATTATNASKLNPSVNNTNANRNVLFAASSSATYESVYKSDGTKMTYNPSTNLLNVTSSFAVSSSQAVASDFSTLANTVRVNVGGTPKTGYPIGGISPGGSSIDVTITYPTLPIPSSLGFDLLITANDASGGSGAIGVEYGVTAPTEISFNGASGDVVYQGYILQ